MASTPRLIALVGPTASGKSDLAVALAKKYHGEIISGDSRQVYRGLNLASGKITKREMKSVPHHLLDVATLRRVFTVSDYRRLAERALKDIVRRGKVPILVGGTGLYIDAVLYNQEIPEAKPDPKLRKKLETLSTTALFAELQRLDPARAASIDRHNPRRLIRALEIVLSTGKPVPALAERHFSNVLKNIGERYIVKIGINPGPEKLKKNIHARLLKRLRQGMIGEIKKLHESGISWKRLEDLGLEARWISRYLRGLISKQDMATSLERDILAYARRQMTWWRKDEGIRWADSPRAAAKLIR